MAALSLLSVNTGLQCHEGIILNLYMYVITVYCMFYNILLITFSPGQNGHHFADNIFKCIFLIFLFILIQISFKFIPWDQVDMSNNWQIPESAMTLQGYWHMCVIRPEWVPCMSNWKYCPKIYNIRCTKSQNLNDSRLVFQLSPPNTLKPGVKSRMKM